MTFGGRVLPVSSVLTTVLAQGAEKPARVGVYVRSILNRAFLLIVEEDRGGRSG
jgi:hypothetical protein